MTMHDSELRRDFHARKRAGRVALLEVARRFELAGLDVIVPSEIETDEPGPSDNDLLVEGRVIEVKSHNTKRYTGPHDWPYPDALLHSVDGWRNLPRKPVAIVLICQATLGLAVAPVSTRDQWIVRDVRDGPRGYTFKAYCVPKHLLRTFGELLIWFRWEQK